MRNGLKAGLHVDLHARCTHHAQFYEGRIYTTEFNEPGSVDVAEN